MVRPGKLASYGIRAKVRQALIPLAVRGEKNVAVDIRRYADLNQRLLERWISAHHYRR
jgi:hypothetical protein